MIERPLTLARAVLDRHDDVPAELDDRDLDPQDWEPAYHAEFAAGRYPSLDPETVRSYWRWMLHDAVPAAWRAVS